MNNRTKKPYETPEITLTQIMVENAICGASAQIVSGNKENASIQEQGVNEDYKPTFDGTGTNNGWDVTSPNTPSGN